MKQFTSKLIVLLLLLVSSKSCTLYAQNEDADSLININYLRNVERYQKRWMKHIPNLATLQWAGNIGYVSAGVGWDYGKNNRWESHVLLGYLPSFIMSDDMFSFSIRQNLLPWNKSLNQHFTFSPAVFSFTANTVLNHEFWYREREVNGDDSYYRFSSALRAHIGFGSRMNLSIPASQRKRVDTISLYYDLSTYDLAIISAFSNRHEHRLQDLVSLGIGIQCRFF